MLNLWDYSRQTRVSIRWPVSLAETGLPPVGLNDLSRPHYEIIMFNMIVKNDSLVKCPLHRHSRAGGNDGIAKI